MPSLDRLIARLSSLIGAATDTLERDPARVDGWYSEVSAQIRRYHQAAYLNGERSIRTSRRSCSS